MTTQNVGLIQPIDKSTVNQICSGQVVLNLATAVKELLENSVDAGATSIQIKLEEYGSDLVEVIDNGCGVEEINFQALTLKHHTSKITNFADLYSVETFGFRGEALSSLCSLSNVTIITQHKNASIGATLKFDHNGIIISNVKTLRKVGTTVRLENLFSTLPIRRTEFLKNLKREFLKMCNVLYAYGLLSVGLRITCTNQRSKTKFTSSQECKNKFTNTTIMDTKGESIESNIISIFGVKQKQNLMRITEKVPIEETLSEFGLQNKKLNFEMFKLDGYISSCGHGCGRTCSDRQFYYINSRPFDNSKISKLVNDIYHQYNNRQDPFVVLNIKVTAGSYDMNVTPDKRQILLQNERLLLATLKESLLAIYKNVPSTLEVQNVGLFKLSSNEHVESASPENLERFKANLDNLSPKKEKSQLHSRVDNLLKYRSSSTNKTENRSSFSTSKNELEESGVSTENEIVLHIPPIKNLSSAKFESKFKVIKDSIMSPKSNLKNFFPTKSNGELVKAAAIGCSLDESICEKNENKRKLLKHEDSLVNEDPKNDREDLNVNEPKRMKFDDGLSEDHKRNRRSIICNIGLSNVKKLALKYANAENIKHEVKADVKFLTEIKPQNNEKAENELKREINKDKFKEMEIIGQFNLGFIITKLGSDVFIVDQHASDEKYNFETLQSNTVIQTQKLFNPEKLELPIDKEELLMEHINIFNKNGFDFVFDESKPPTKRISLSAVPFSKNVIFGKEDVDELLFFVENAPEIKTHRPSKVRSMFASRACRKSVKVGNALSCQEMRKIVDHMGEIEQPWNCPHGRPTMRHLVNLHMIQLGK